MEWPGMMSIGADSRTTTPGAWVLRPGDTFCPTACIKFGEISELREQANDRLAALNRRGIHDATIYDPNESSVRGTHAMFILRGDPQSYNLPPSPEVPTAYLKKAWTSS